MSEENLRAIPQTQAQLDEARLAEKAPADIKPSAYEPIKFDEPPSVHNLQGNVFLIAERFWGAIRTMPLPVKREPPVALGLLCAPEDKPEIVPKEHVISNEANAILGAIGSPTQQGGLLNNELKALESILTADQEMRNQRVLDPNIGIAKVASDSPQAADQLIKWGRNANKKTLDKLKTHEQKQIKALEGLFVVSQKNGKNQYKTITNQQGEVIADAHVVEQFHKDLEQLLLARQIEIRNQVTKRYQEDEKNINARLENPLQTAAFVAETNRCNKIIATANGLPFTPLTFSGSGPLKDKEPLDFSIPVFEQNKDKAVTTYFEVKGGIKQQMKKFPFFHKNQPMYVAATITKVMKDGKIDRWEMDIWCEVTLAIAKSAVMALMAKGCKEINVSGMKDLDAKDKRELALHIISLTGNPNSVPEYANDKSLQKAAAKNMESARKKLNLNPAPSDKAQVQREQLAPIQEEVHTPKPFKNPGNAMLNAMVQTHQTGGGGPVPGDAPPHIPPVLGH